MFMVKYNYGAEF